MKQQTMMFSFQITINKNKINKKFEFRIVFHFTVEFQVKCVVCDLRRPTIHNTLETSFDTAFTACMAVPCVPKSWNVLTFDRGKEEWLVVQYELAHQMILFRICFFIEIHILFSDGIKYKSKINILCCIKKARSIEKY